MSNWKSRETLAQKRKREREREMITHEFCTSTCAHVYFVYCCDELCILWILGCKAVWKCGFSCHSNIITSISHTFPLSRCSNVSIFEKPYGTTTYLSSMYLIVRYLRHTCKAPWINDSSRRRFAATTISYWKKKRSDLFCYTRAGIMREQTTPSVCLSSRETDTVLTQRR